jgi:hypothetical protein
MILDILSRGKLRFSWLLVISSLNDPNHNGMGDEPVVWHVAALLPIRLDPIILFRNPFEKTLEKNLGVESSTVHHQV